MLVSDGGWQDGKPPVTLADKYRPQRFEDVWCQEAAVTLLSRLAQARQGTNLLLTGAYGAGKTSLVRLFARALNCEHVTEYGSPCNQCRSCEDPQQDYLLEYDVPGRGGDKDKVRAWVDAHHRSSRKWRILFLDEAHALMPAAVDSLLKDVEEPEPGVAFAFATTEPWALKPTLKSRLMPLEVRPLGVPDAVEFMESIAQREGILYDREGLILLASVKQGHPRDLLNGLGQLAGLGTRVTTESVKSLFAIHDAESLIEYFLALAAGDAEREILAMRRWREPLTSKVKGVQTLLTSIFYNELLGQKIVIDALLDSLTSSRAEIVAGFCSRFGVDRRNLIPHWEKMLAFWAQAQRTDEENSRLRLCLFEDLVNRRLTQETVSSFASKALIEHPAVTWRPEPAESWPNNTLQQPSGPDRAGDQYLGPKHVREIVNRASFFIQHHGRMMNAAFTIYPPWQARSSERKAIDTVEKFRNNLDDLSKKTGEPYASIAVLERDESGIVGRVVAHIPQIVEAPTYRAALAQWCERFDLENENGVSVELDVYRGKTNAQALKFHWDRLLELCAALDDQDENAASARQLLDDLQISRSVRRNSGPIRHAVLEFSGVLTTMAIERDCANQMMPLSAFDARAWAWIRKGWERAEYTDRQEEIRNRERQLIEVEKLWAKDKERHQAEMDYLMNDWARGPEGRARSWRGWWLP
jgi:DNA polymerase-3 subunit gamma/tau